MCYFGNKRSEQTLLEYFFAHKEKKSCQQKKLTKKVTTKSRGQIMVKVSTLSSLRDLYFAHNIFLCMNPYRFLSIHFTNVYRDPLSPLILKPNIVYYINSYFCQTNLGQKPRKPQWHVYVWAVSEEKCPLALADKRIQISPCDSHGLIWISFVANRTFMAWKIQISSVK